MRHQDATGALALAAALCAAAAWGGYADFVARAHRAVEDAQDAAHAAGPGCEKAVATQLEAALQHLTELHQNRTPARVKKASAELSGVGMGAVLAGCPNAVADGIREGTELLDQARAARVRESSSDEPAAAAATPAASLMTDVELQRILHAVQKTKDEFSKGDVVKNALGSTQLSNEQLGLLLDQMNSDFIKLDLVTAAAPRIADPQAGSAIARHFDDADMGRQAAAVLVARAAHGN